MLWGQVATLRADVAAARTQLLVHEQRLAALDDARVASSWRDTLLSSLWLAHQPIAEHPLVTVVLPTHSRDRLELLREAIDSVRAQTYPHWELLVIDNSPDDMLAELPGWWPVDHRIGTARSAPPGAAAARNVGLAAARGQLIAYLDDDCTWFPWWLRCAVTMLASAPDAQFGYGIRISGRPGSTIGMVQAAPLSPLLLHLDNFVDTNTLIHRSGLGETWDESLTSCGDYDLLVRLAALDSVFVPVPACAYGVGTPGQLWATERFGENAQNRAQVRRRARQRRPLRVVAFNALYPLITETYIGDELEALRRCDVDVVLSRSRVGPADCAPRVDAPLFESLTEAMDHHDPDLVLAHWGQVGIPTGRFAAERGVPHAARLRSFCEDIDDGALFTEWCIGTWGPPTHVRRHPLAHSLPTLIIDPAPMADDAHRTRSIASVSAGLPKKDWPTLVAAAALVAGAPLHITIGTTSGYESVPDDVARMLADTGIDADLQVNANYAAAQQVIRTAGVLLYSIGVGNATGQPRSVIEAALSGTPLAVPDMPSLRDLLGGTAHFYRPGDADSMAAAIEGALTTPHSWDERVTLADTIRRGHSTPQVFEAWAHSLTAAVVAWQQQRLQRSPARTFWLGS